MAVDFAAYVFPGRNTAEIALRDAEDAVAVGAAWIEDVAVIKRGKLGRVVVHSTWAQDNDWVAGSTGWGALTGALLGALAGPGGALAGLLAGGAFGSLFGAVSDMDVADPALEDLAASLENDTSALVLIGETGSFIAAFEAAGAKLIQTAIAEEILERLTTPA